MNYGEIKKTDIANGTGVRVSLFVSGCRHHCKGCFNQMTWDFDYGQPYTQNTEKEIAALGVKVKGYASNAANFEDTEKVVNQIKDDFGSVDILVNNAGITKDGLMMRMSEAQWDAVIAVNLKSAFNFIHACTPIMMRQKSGSIINMASVVGVMGNAGQSNYAAAKAGVIGFTKSMAKELASRNINVNAVAPGYISTDMTANLPEQAKLDLQSQIPLQRLGNPEDVAAAGRLCRTHPARQ